MKIDVSEGAAESAGAKSAVRGLRVIVKVDQTVSRQPAEAAHRHVLTACTRLSSR